MEFELDPGLKEAVARIVTRLSPSRIVLFGSRAWGEVEDESDYDLLVLVDQADNPRALESEAYRSLAGLPASFDVLVRSSNWWAQWWDTPFSIERRIETEGVTIHES
jgi:predicted nucleotidyltransferase